MPRATTIVVAVRDEAGNVTNLVDENGKAIDLGNSGGAGVASISVTGPLVKGGTASAPALSMPAATTAADGYMTAVQATALAAKKNAEAAPTAITANLTLAAANDGQTLYNATATARTITVAKDLPNGFGVAIAQNSTGAVTVVAAADVTILSNPAITKTGGAGTMLALTQTAPNTYTLAGQGVA